MFDGITNIDPPQSPIRAIGNAKQKRLLLVLSKNTRDAIEYNQKSTEASVGWNPIYRADIKEALQKNGDLRPMINDLVAELRERFSSVSLANDLSNLSSGAIDFVAVVDFEFANLTFSNQTAKAVIAVHFLDASQRKVSVVTGEGEKRGSGWGQKDDYLASFIARDAALKALVTKLPQTISP